MEEEEIKLSVQQVINEFQILNVPASFDPNSADVKLKYLNAEDEKHFKLQQTIISLPDPKNVQQIIEREKSAIFSSFFYSRISYLLKILIKIFTNHLNFAGDLLKMVLNDARYSFSFECKPFSKSG